MLKILPQAHDSITRSKVIYSSNEYFITIHKLSRTHPDNAALRAKATHHHHRGGIKASFWPQTTVATTTQFERDFFAFFFLLLYNQTVCLRQFHTPLGVFLHHKLNLFYSRPGGFIIQLKLAGAKGEVRSVLGNEDLRSCQIKMYRVD